jgi:hypothetical protein
MAMSGGEIHPGSKCVPVASSRRLLVPPALGAASNEEFAALVGKDELLTAGRFEHARERAARWDVRNPLVHI